MWIFIACASVCAAENLAAYRPGEVLIRFKSHTRAAALSRFASIGAKPRRSIVNGRVQQMILPPGLTVAEALSLYRDDPDVEFVEPNYLLAAQMVLPDDPYFEKQWGLHNTGQVVNGFTGRPGADIDAVRAWELAAGGTVAVVAVVDTGCNPDHPDLAGNLWVNPNEIEGNGIDDDGNGYVDDIRGWDFVDGDNNPQDASGHGSHVAGIIAALDSNGIGGAGIARNVRIMPLRFMNTFELGTVADAIDAIEYALAQGVRIINCSWGGTGYSSALFNLMASADALFVCAAGNTGTDNDTAGFYPAGFPLENIVAVAATDQVDQLAWFSNKGRLRVHVAAPGARIHSLGVGLQVLWSDSFDDVGLNGWTKGGHPDAWIVRAAPLGAGSSVLAVSAGDLYADNVDGWVMSPPLGLAQASACRLSFQLMGASEANRDYFNVEVSTDAAVWSKRPVKLGGDIYYGGISGTIPSWTTAVVDLGPWDGRVQLYVRFRFTSDATHPNTGFFIDNLSLSAASDAEAYQFMSGTSMAAGFVSGVAALVQSRHEDLLPDALKAILLGSVDLDQSLAAATSTGGRINAFNALTLLRDLSLSADAGATDAVRLNWWGQVPLGGEIAVERRSDSEAEFQVVAYVDASGIGYTDSAVEPETTYIYRVLAQTQDGRSGYSNQTSATTPISSTGGGGGGGGGGGCFIETLTHSKQADHSASGPMDRSTSFTSINRPMR